MTSVSTAIFLRVATQILMGTIRKLSLELGLFCVSIEKNQDKDTNIFGKQLYTCFVYEIHFQIVIKMVTSLSSRECSAILIFGIM